MLCRSGGIGLGQVTAKDNGLAQHVHRLSTRSFHAQARQRDLSDDSRASATCAQRGRSKI
eukprot:3402032-Pyramimonas_sp.AAC.1